MIYELTELSLLPNRLGDVNKVLPKIYSKFSQHGDTIGCFSVDFGRLNRFLFLTKYEDENALANERTRISREDDPYGIREHLGGVDRTAYRPLRFSRDVEPGDFGPFYEFRTYTVAPGGIPETENAWEKVITRREELSPLLLIMESIERAPKKMVHIWPYKSLEDRVSARREASKEGIWPPPGGSNQLQSLQSELTVAVPVSDLK